jgi:hypothetical protein
MLNCCDCLESTRIRVRAASGTAQSKPKVFRQEFHAVICASLDGYCVLSLTSLTDEAPFARNLDFDVAQMWPMTVDDRENCPHDDSLGEFDVFVPRVVSGEARQLGFDTSLNVRNLAEGALIYPVHILCW